MTSNWKITDELVFLKKNILELKRKNVDEFRNIDTKTYNKKTMFRMIELKERLEKIYDELRTKSFEKHPEKEYKKAIKRAAFYGKTIGDIKELIYWVLMKYYSLDELFSFNGSIWKVIKEREQEIWLIDGIDFKTKFWEMMDEADKNEFFNKQKTNKKTIKGKGNRNEKINNKKNKY